MNWEIFSPKLLDARLCFNRKRHIDLRTKLFIKRLICKINLLKKGKYRIVWTNQQFRTTPIGIGDTSPIPIPLLLDGCTIYNIEQAWCARLGFYNFDIETAIYEGFCLNCPRPKAVYSDVGHLLFKITRYIYILSILKYIPSNRDLYTSLPKQLALYIEGEWTRLNL